MNILKGNAVVGQSGGPTSAINATLSGVLKGVAKRKNAIEKIFGMRFGIEGFIEEKLVDLTQKSEDTEWLSVLESTPASALGSCRRRLKDFESDRDAYKKIFQVLQKYNIRYFFYIGGNDSMDTVLKLREYAKTQSFEVHFIGIPKTIDNDLAITDHTPGFGSAAKYIATAVREIKRDISVYTVKAVTIVEIMGRDAGWLTTASAIPSIVSDAPDFIYLPERAFDKNKFIADLKRLLELKSTVLVAVSEGIRDEKGEYICDSDLSFDAFGHRALSGTGKALERLVRKEIKCKVRSIELNTPQRAAAHIASKTDIDESIMAGEKGVYLATDENKTGAVVIFKRKIGKDYAIEYSSTDVENIANLVKNVPSEFINEEGNGVTEACINYLKPLILGERNIEYEYGMPKHIII